MEELDVVGSLFGMCWKRRLSHMLFGSRPIQLSAILPICILTAVLGDIINREPSEHGAARYNGCDDEGDLWQSALHRKGAFQNWMS